MLSTVQLNRICLPILTPLRHVDMGWMLSCARSEAVFDFRGITLPACYLAMTCVPTVQAFIWWQSTGTESKSGKEDSLYGLNLLVINPQVNLACLILVSCLEDLFLKLYQVTFFLNLSAGQGSEVRRLPSAHLGRAGEAREAGGAALSVSRSTDDFIVDCDTATSSCLVVNM